MKKIGNHILQILTLLLILQPLKQAPFTTTSYIDKASNTATDNFVFAEYSKDFVFGFTYYGKSVYKPLASDSLSTNNFGVQNMNPFYFASCWKSVNECVFAGYQRIEYWKFENSEQKLKKTFTYSMTNLVNANKFRVVKVIESTNYFVAGDFANIGLTRWKKTQDTKFVWFSPRESDTAECQDIIVIPKTHYIISIFDEIRNLFILDFTTMTQLSTMSAGITFEKGGRLAHITRYPSSYLVAGLQNENGSNTHIILYNYNDRTLARTVPAQTTLSTAYTVHSLAYVPDSDYLLYVVESGGKGILGLWRIDKNQAITGYKEETAGVVAKWAFWLPAKKQFLVAKESGIVLLSSDACSSDCKDDGANYNTQCSSGLLIDGCTKCHDSSNAPCSAKTGEVGTISSPKDPSTANFAGDVLLVNKNETSSDITGIFLANSNLKQVRDQENSTAALIGLICSVVFVLIILAIWIILCFKRLGRKKIEVAAYKKEMSRTTRPIWDDEELNSEEKEPVKMSNLNRINNSGEEKNSAVDNTNNDASSVGSKKNIVKEGKKLDG